MSCVQCSPVQFVAERADTFRTAYALLRDLGWDMETVDIGEVHLIARFLSGDAMGIEEG